MSGGRGRWRQAVAVVAGVIVGAVVNVATGMLTRQWDLAWLAATVVALVVGGGLLAWLTVRGAADTEPAGPKHMSASGDGAIGAGGSVIGSSTKVTRPPAVDPTPPARSSGADEGVSASGLGAIAASGDVRDSRTEVTRDDPAAS